MRTIYHDPVTGITVKKGNDWPVRVVLTILAIGTGVAGWYIGYLQKQVTEPVVETMQVIPEEVVEEPLPPWEIKPSQEAAATANPQIHNDPRVAVEVNVYNSMRGGDTSVETRIEQLKEQFAQKMAKSSAGMTFAEYDLKLAMLSTGADLNNPEDFRRAIHEMARISSQYWGFEVQPTTDDVFDRWHTGVQQYKEENPDFKSAILTEAKTAFRSAFDE